MGCGGRGNVLSELRRIRWRSSRDRRLSSSWGDSTSVLIDVRTQAEWTYVGTPDIQALGKTPLFVEWQSYPSMEVDPQLRGAPVEALLKSAGVERGAPLLFLCRSGARSRHAAIAMTARRVGALLQCVGRIRGPLDPHADADVVGGWKAGDCPGRRRKRSRVPFQRHLPPSAVPPYARDPTMGIRTTNRSPIARPGAFRRVLRSAQSWRRCCERLRAEARRGRLQQLVRAASNSKPSPAARRGFPCRRASSRAGSTPTISATSPPALDARSRRARAHSRRRSARRRAPSR